ncbi:MAG: hypothetical protein ACXV7G_12125, partial [Halobacteriota archaeon]
MQFHELQKRLKVLGVDVSSETLHNWKNAGLITSPRLITRQEFKKRHLIGPGRRYVKKPGPKNYDWPEEAVYEAAGCWGARHLAIDRADVSNETLKRVEVLAEAFYKNIDAVDLRPDYAPDGAIGTYFSSYDIHTLFIAYVAAYEKAWHNRLMKQRVNIKYLVMEKMNCSRVDSFEVKHFYPVVGVELENIDTNRDRIMFDFIEPWEYIDPATDERYEIVRDEAGCHKFVKTPSPGERFL